MKRVRKEREAEGHSRIEQQVLLSEEQEEVIAGLRLQAQRDNASFRRQFAILFLTVAVLCGRYCTVKHYIYTSLYTCTVYYTHVYILLGVVLLRLLLTDIDMMFKLREGLIVQPSKGYILLEYALTCCVLTISAAIVIQVIPLSPPLLPPPSSSSSSTFLFSLSSSSYYSTFFNNWKWL